MTFFSRKHLRLLLLPALLLLTGCAGSAKETADSTENEKLSAVATIFPQYDFLRAIGGFREKVKTSMIVGGGRIGSYLAALLLSAGIHVKII